MTVVSISEAARLIGRARSTMYRRIHAGELSTTKQHDGSDGIDTAELFRVFGEPSSGDGVASDDGSSVAPRQHATNSERDALQAQVDLLQEQLQEAKERERRLLGMVENSQRLLEAPQRRGIIERIANAIRQARGQD